MRRLAPITLLLLLALALAAPAAHASTGQATSFEAPDLLLNDSTRSDALDEIDGFGVRSLRVLLYWRSVAPSPADSTRPAFDATDPSAYPGWGPWDRLFAAARDRGMSVLVTITGPAPTWATTSRDPDGIDRPDPGELERFATAVGRRYGTQIDRWSIWNEPNQPQFLGPQYRKGKPYSPGLYRRLYLAAHRGLAASGNGSDQVLIGETSPRGNRRIVAPLAFLRGTLCLSSSYRRRRGCAGLDADGYAHHAYTTRGGPFFVPPDKDDVTIGVLSRLIKALDGAARAGALPRRLPVFLTEFGIQSYPDRVSGVPTPAQSDYRSISEYIAYRNPRVAGFSQYLLRDSQPLSGPRSRRYSGFESGLRFANGRRKPSYDSFRLPLVAQRRGGGVRLWGLARPAGAAVQVSLEYADVGRGFRRLKTVSTNAAGYFATTGAFRPGRRYRVRWTAPDGTSYSGPPTSAYTL